MPAVTIELEHRQLSISCRDVDEASLLFSVIRNALASGEYQSVDIRTRWGAHYFFGDKTNIVGISLQPTSPDWLVESVIQAGILQGKAQVRVNAALQKEASNVIVPVKGLS